MTTVDVYEARRTLTNAVSEYRQAHTWADAVSNTAVGGWVCKVGSTLYDTVFVRALARLYLYGPALGGYGFWEGREAEDICASITGNRADFWKDHPEECSSILDRKFYSWLVVFEVVLYFVVMYKGACAVVRRASRKAGAGVTRAARANEE